MEFKTGDIIYYAAIIGFFIYSIIKKRNKQADKTGSPSENIPDFETILKEVITKKEEVVVQQPIKQPEKPKIKPKAKPVQTFNYKNEGVSSFNHTKTDSAFIIDDAPVNNTIFDLKSAIIYSEILGKPIALRE